VRLASTVTAWFIVATVAIGVGITLVSPEQVGPRMADALWAGALIVVATLVAGRVFLASGLEALGRSLMRRSEGDARTPEDWGSGRR
jgi:hypothetical protein